MEQKPPPFAFLRVITIPIWMAIHYAIAAFIMFFAVPSPTVAEIERVSNGVITHSTFGMVFLISALVMAFDTNITPRKFRMYLLAWLAYVIATGVYAFRALITNQDVPGIYLAFLTYAGEMVFMLISYSTLHSVWNVSQRLANMEPLWRKLLSKTDLKWLDRD